MYRYALLSTLCLVASPLNAGEVNEIEARSIELGGFRGIIYYTHQGDGYHVVTTIAEGDTGSPVRFEATLNDGQKITISIPSKVGEPSSIVEVVRSNHKLIVGPQAANDAVILTLRSKAMRGVTPLGSLRSH